MILCCSLHLEIYIYILLKPCPLRGVCGGGGNQGMARLALTVCGIAVSEIFIAIRKDLRCCF